MPNETLKCSTDYSVNTPVFFTNDAMGFIARHVSHLVTDIPSIDSPWDDGNLSNHRIFWNVPMGEKNLSRDTRVKALITEMVFIPNEIPDGRYQLLTQVPRFLSDAAPSRLTLF